mgnify:CR=1 FL=1
MKKIITATIMTALIVSTGYAQQQASASVDANVLANLTIAKDFDVNFGNIPATGTPILDPIGVSNTDVGTQAVVGEFTVNGSAGSQISVTYPTTLTLGNGTETISFNTDLKGHADTQASAVAIVSPVTIGGAGAYKFWLGGNLGTLTNQATGLYASDNATNGGGDFTLTVEYY